MNNRQKKYVDNKVDGISREFQDWIRDKMKDMELSQREVCDFLDINEFTMSRKMNNNRDFTLSEMVAMAYAVGLKIEVRLEDL